MNTLINSDFSFNWPIDPIRPTIDLPPLPKFLSLEAPEWTNFIEFLQFDLQKHFPNGRCHDYASWLYLYLALIYDGQLDSSRNLIIQIPGEGQATVIPREQELWGFERSFSNHYFIELHFLNGDSWIMDATWKQFMHPEHSSKVNYNNPHHKDLVSKYPDLMIAQPNSFFSFLDKLGQSIESEDLQTSLMIKNSKGFWHSNSSDRSIEFAEIFKLGSESTFSKIAVMYYTLPTLDLYWPILLIAANKPSSSLREFCRNIPKLS